MRPELGENEKTRDSGVDESNGEEEREGKKGDGDGSDGITSGGDNGGRERRGGRREEEELGVRVEERERIGDSDGGVDMGAMVGAGEGDSERWSALA